MTKTWVVNPLRVQNVACSGTPMYLPLIFIAVDERKSAAITKSLIARPLHIVSEIRKWLDLTHKMSW
jgi:hypothetical protein